MYKGTHKLGMEPRVVGHEEAVIPLYEPAKLVATAKKPVNL